MAIAVAEDGGRAIAVAPAQIIDRPVEVPRSRNRKKCWIITVVIIVLLVIAGVATGVAIYEKEKNDDSGDDGYDVA
jgi:hypothetical protein